MAVRKTEDGKTRRTAEAGRDPLRLVSKRGGPSEDRRDTPHAGLPRNRSRVRLYGCVSMWKNQSSEVVPLRTRLIHDRFGDVPVEVNGEAFSELKKALDKAEDYFMNESHKSIE
jgi:hypothetical protein